MPTIEELLHRRADLSTFIVHLTRTTDVATARQNLLSIASEHRLRARSPLGMVKDRVDEVPGLEDTQRVVCFTETPLEHTWMMCEAIALRQVVLEPYGLAFTKKWARRRGANPVWYLDMTIGHDWLTEPVNDLVDATIASGGGADSPIFKLTPFVEQMFTHPMSQKEFWWEREWRYSGDMTFTTDAVVTLFVPEADHDAFRGEMQTLNVPAFRLLDARWGLERMIAGLAEVHSALVGPF